MISESKIFVQFIDDIVVRLLQVLTVCFVHLALSFTGQMREELASARTVLINGIPLANHRVDFLLRAMVEGGLHLAGVSRHFRRDHRGVLQELRIVRQLGQVANRRTVLKLAAVRRMGRIGTFVGQSCELPHQFVE